MAKKLDNSEVCHRFSTLYNGEYELTEPYKGNGQPTVIKHKKCGKTFTISRLTRFFNQSNDCPCPYCREKSVPTRLTKEEYSILVNKTYNNKYTVLNFTGMHDKATLKCNNCGHVFQTTANNLTLKNRFSGCPVCDKSKRGQHQVIENYLEDVLNRFPDGSEYEWKEEYKGRNSIKHLIHHKVCGHDYLVRPNDFTQGYRCPFCARRRSKSEVEFAKYIKENICNDIIESDRSQINPYELDLYIPSKKVAIEYDGLFWHSEDQKGKKYHEEKRKNCEEKGIRLIQIYEDEWKDHRDIVISKLKSILGVRSKNIIYARKCICKKIENPKEYIDFLNKNHIQGGVSIKVVYGLYYNDTLVAVGGFNKLRSSMNLQDLDNSWDMIRYATDINTSVIGGCGKIIFTFVKNEKCKYIKTLADLRWSSSIDNMYTKLGFTKANYVEPRYFYTDGHKRFPRFDFRKERIKNKFPNLYDPKLTEFQMMDKTNLKRIWDAGKITYEKYF